MQFIRDIYAAKKASGQPVISFEFFPPKTAEGERNLLEKHIPALAQAHALPFHWRIWVDEQVVMRDRLSVPLLPPPVRPLPLAVLMPAIPPPLPARTGRGRGRQGIAEPSRLLRAGNERRSPRA